MSGVAPLVVSVAHGDLRRTRFPVAVGHYAGDVIVNAEDTLDRALGGVLRQHFAVGRYPGEPGTVEICLRPECHPPGAIIVGLGKVGELTAERLRDAMAGALKAYALRRLHLAPAAAARPVSASFSTVLIGTDGGAFNALGDSVHTIVRAALHANRSLREAGLGEQVVIREIEIIELYEDVAIRAAQVAAALPGPIGRELLAGETVVGNPSMEVYEGGRSLQPGSPYSAGWWQRIAVRRRPQLAGAATQGSDATDALTFSVLTDRARVEQGISVGQRALLQQLITKATNHTHIDPEGSAALYQLLVPDPVKDRIRQGGSLLFMVDRAGAGYPFELMAERGVNGFELLAGADRGILRQFETEVFRRNPEMATKNEIFVVGNPKTILWESLPGAEEEAREVAEVASAAGLTVVTAPREDPEATIVKLVTGEYRILHLAAHGQFDPDPMKSGLVVGDRLRITPAEVAAMPRVPELVFINACYLGQMGEARPGGPDPRLAASLAEGFIQAGVRAVIAAGWAVDDRAGRTFAKVFYQEFLEGRPFGEAVRHARLETRAQHPEVNTWGAYQCYGNPEYSFRQVERPRAHRALPVVVARAEALQALRTIAGDARRVSLTEVGSFTKRFDDLLEAIGGRWSDGEILHACGEICGEVGDFTRAVSFYERALRSETATAPLRAAEQLVNLLVRAAAQPDASPGAAAQRAAAFDRALQLLNWLDAQMGESTERWDLRGSLFKRRAVWEREDRRRHIQRAIRAYARARHLSPKASYGGLNAFAMRFVAARPSRLRRLRRDIDAYCDGLRTQDGAGARDFWDFAEPGDALLTRSVIHAAFDERTVSDVLAKYEQARRVGPTPRQWASVCDQVAFLAAMTGDERLPCFNPATAAALARIAAALDVAGAAARVD